MSRPTSLLLNTVALVMLTAVGMMSSAEAAPGRTCHDLFRSQRGYTGLLQNAARVHVISELKKILPAGIHDALVNGKRRRVSVAYDPGSVPGMPPYRIASVTVRISGKDLASTESSPLVRRAADGSPGTLDDAEYSRAARLQLLADNHVLIANDVTDGHIDHRRGLLVTNLGLDIDLHSVENGTGGDRVVHATYYQEVRTVSKHMPNKTATRKSDIQILIKNRTKSSK